MSSDPDAAPPQSHYFTGQQPATEAELRTITADLGAGRVRLVTAGGTFSPDGLDQASALLLDEVPPPPATGHGLDLGCGWGPIALAMAQRSETLEVSAVDVSARALDLTRRNAAAVGVDQRVHACLPDEVPPERAFDVIWSNPPIRIGKVALHAMLRHWLPRLSPTGAAYLVVGKNLGADSLHAWIAEDLAQDVERVSSRRGFRVLRVAPRA